MRASDGVAEGQPYIAMEYVPGSTLKSIIAGSAPLPPDEAIAYARQVLAGLGAVHALGIVHREIKPHNLIVRDDGALKIVGRALARRDDPDPAWVGHRHGGLHLARTGTRRGGSC